MATDWALPLSQSCFVPSPGSSPYGSREEKGLTGLKGHKAAGFRGKGQRDKESHVVIHIAGDRGTKEPRVTETQPAMRQQDSV